MKRIVCIAMLVLLMLSQTCMGMVIYPEIPGSADIKANERINIVFDNSGHDDVKRMFMDVITAASVAENSEIWIYPIAGSISPVKVEPNQEFMSKNFVAYSKPSNEFKSENMVDLAIADLKADTAYTTKRLIMYGDSRTSEIRAEYDIYEIDAYVIANPDIIFSSFSSGGTCLELDFVKEIDYPAGSEFFDFVKNVSNYDAISGKNLHEFLLVKYGYSECEVQYDEEQGVLKIPKGQADSNVFVTAMTYEQTLKSGFNSEDVESALYLGGCMMDEEGLETYKAKKKVSGVALAYNYIATDGGEPYESFVAALYTADGSQLDPMNEDLYIPLINSREEKVYYRSTKGAGICSKDTSYDTTRDKSVFNYEAPKDAVQNSGKVPVTSGKTDNTDVLGVILGFIGSLLGIVLSVVFSVLYIGILVFVVGMIFSPKFRGFVHLKIVGSKFEPVYEFISGKIISLINGIKGAGAAIKGTVNESEDFIFISKASKDMEHANNRISLVVNELNARGINCWLSEIEIKPGEDYNEVLPKAIADCTLMVFFVSINSINSPEVESEIGTAKQNKKIIVPIQIEKFDLYGKFPKWSHMLKQYQKADLFSSNEDKIKAIADDIEDMFVKQKRNK